MQSNLPPQTLNNLHILDSNLIAKLRLTRSLWIRTYKFYYFDVFLVHLLKVYQWPLNHVGYAIFSLSYIVPFTKQPWFIVTMSVQFISLVTRSNIKEQNILNWIFILFAKRSLVAKSEFCMYHHDIKL